MKWGGFPHLLIHSQPCKTAGDITGSDNVVSPGDPEYLLECIKKLWHLNISLDKQSESPRIS